MTEAVGSLTKRPLCLNLLLQMHRTLMDGVRGQDRGRGKFRQVQNWIGRSDSTLKTAKFVPPDPVVMQESLSNWEKYLHIEEPDRLVQLAVIHAQFEIIHPFTDGNGRLGRMLVPLFLSECKLLSSPMFYLSAYLERHRATYYERLHGITAAGEWNEWVSFFLTAIIEQAQENYSKAKDILTLYEEMKGRIPKIIASEYSIQTLDALFVRPIFNTSEFASRTGMPKRTAQRILKSLLEQNVLAMQQEARGITPSTLRFAPLLEITGDVLD